MLLKLVASNAGLVEVLKVREVLIRFFEMVAVPHVVLDALVVDVALLVDVGEHEGAHVRRGEAVHVAGVLRRRVIVFDQMSRLLSRQESVEVLLFKDLLDLLEELVNGLQRTEPADNLAETFKANRIVKGVAEDGAEALDVDLLDLTKVKLQALDEGLLEVSVGGNVVAFEFPKLLADLATQSVWAHEIDVDLLELLQDE